jgi:hypothetical protein
MSLPTLTNHAVYRRYLVSCHWYETFAEWLGRQSVTL